MAMVLREDGGGYATGAMIFASDDVVLFVWLGTTVHIKE